MADLGGNSGSREPGLASRPGPSGFDPGRDIPQTIEESRQYWEYMQDCPFCGAKASEFHISVSSATDMQGVVCSFMGECAECGAMGPSMPTPWQAMDWWDARKGATK